MSVVAEPLAVIFDGTGVIYSSSSLPSSSQLRGGWTSQYGIVILIRQDNRGIPLLSGVYMRFGGSPRPLTWRSSHLGGLILTF